MIDREVEDRVGEHLDAGNLERAATEAVRGYGPQILGYLRSALPASDADDAFSIFCEFLWKGLPKFRRESSLLTWSYQLAWGAVRRVIENPHRRRMEHLPSSAMNNIAQEIRSSTATHLKKETSDQLAKIRAELDAEEQTLLVLRIDRDLPWTDVATIMEVDEPALRKRFERLKAKIKKLSGR